MTMPHSTSEPLQVVTEQTRLFQRDYERFSTYMARISPRIPCADLLLAPHYVEVKLNDVRRHLRSLYDRRTALSVSLARHRAHSRLSSELETIEATLTDKEKELVVLARQTRAVQQDLADELRTTPRVDDAYFAVLAHKMMVSTRNARARSLSLGRTAVAFAYYGTLGADGRAHCALWGSIPFAQVAPTHIVPPTLQGDGLAHLLGVRELDLSEPRNMLPLESKVAEAFTDGHIIFVPAGPFSHDNPAWKCVLVDKRREHAAAGFERRWKDLNGALLRFPNNHRPANRYLFFRFFMAYLEGSCTGHLEWLKDVTIGGRIWACEAAVARRSMLQGLAERLADVDLPEDKIFGHTMFRESPKSQVKSVTEDEEEDLLTSLIARWKCEQKQKKQDDSTDERSA